jgi:hypothetical protein
MKRRDETAMSRDKALHEMLLFRLNVKKTQVYNNLAFLPNFS